MQPQTPESSPRVSAHEAPQPNQISRTAPLPPTLQRAAGILPLQGFRQPGDAAAKITRVADSVPRRSPADDDTIAGHVNNARQILELAQLLHRRGEYDDVAVLESIDGALVRLRFASELLERERGA